MKRPLKTNQRKKLLNRQHNKMSSRRLSHFNQSMSAESDVQQAVSER
ncbi:hypothetical protein [Colwellia sp. E2M01]|nr:hypothetical protein [Colwellia sp. E2M01]MBU2871349.1 hypothetical protein [Colwellia sp. E2M01]